MTVVTPPFENIRFSRFSILLFYDQPPFYYGTAVYWARLAGVAGGYGNGIFGLGDSITREQLAVTLMRFCENIAQ